MSKMNLQKLRQVCYRNQHGYPEMNIILDPNDLKNRMEYTKTWPNKYIERRTAQAVSINLNWADDDKIEVRYNYIWDPNDEPLDVYYDSEDDLIKYNTNFSEDFLPRLREILVEHGFHRRYLPVLIPWQEWQERSELNKFPNILYYEVMAQLVQQIRHACYNDGRSMRAAVEFQAELNKK